MKYFINQRNEYTCGEACTKMILSIFQNDENFLYLNFTNVTLDNFKDIILKGREYGVNGEGFSVTHKKAFRKVKGWLILQLKIASKEHFVVAKKVSPRSYLVLDPAKDEYYLSEKKLWTFFTGKFIKFTRVKKVKAPKINAFKPKKKYYIFSVILNLLMLTSLAFGLYYSSNSELFWLSITFFVLTIVFHLLEKINNLLMLKKYDDYVISPKVSSLNNKISHKINEIYRLKTPIVSYPFIVVNKLLITLTIAIIFIINDWVNAPILLLIALLYYLEFYRNKQINAASLDIDLLVDKIEKANQNAEPFHMYVDKINKLSRNLAIQKIGFRYFIYLITIGLTLILMYINATYTLNYFLFHFFGYLYFGSIVCELFSIDGLKAKRNNSLNKYLLLK